MNYSTYKVKSFDSKELAVHHWGGLDSVASVIVVHGMAEHGKRYQRLAEFLNKRRIDIYVADQRGHGLTAIEGEAGFLSRQNGWDLLVDDVHAIYESLRVTNANPVFFLGHSMGSIVLMSYLQKYGNIASGYIFSSLAYQQDLLAGIGIFAAKIQASLFGKKSPGKLHNALSFGVYNGKFKPNRTKFDWLSRDEIEVDRYIADPFCGQMFTCSFYQELSRGVRWIYSKKNMDNLKKETNCLFLFGSEDPVGGGEMKSEESFRKFWRKMPGSKRIEYSGARHEILNETNREEAHKDILTWINQIYDEKMD